MEGQRVYIIGFMGSGKSTAGKKLAALMGWSFVDLDKKVEESTGKSIPEIFESPGEEYFRNTESSVLRNLSSGNNVVISTGGGAPCHNNNMDYMLETGLTIYLKLTPAQLKGRLAESKTERPLIKNISSDKLLTYIENKLTLREKFYNRSHIQVDGFDIDCDYLHSLVKKVLTPEI